MTLVNATSVPSTQQSRPATFSNVLVALNALCVLEAAIAVAWQQALAVSLEVTLAFHQPTLLFASVWLVYVADRWCDANLGPPRRLISARHRFFARYRGPLFAAWALALLASVGLAWVRLSAQQWQWCALVLAGTLAYLAVIHLRGARGLAKESAVAVIYTAGIGVFVWPQVPLGARAFVTAGLFAALVFCNLAVIAAFERGIDRQLGVESLATHRQHIEGRIAAGAWLLVATALVAALNFRQLWSWCLAVALAAMLQLWLLRWRRVFHVDTAHALADCALLPPLFLCYALPL